MTLVYSRRLPIAILIDVLDRPVMRGEEVCGTFLEAVSTETSKLHAIHTTITSLRCPERKNRTVRGPICPGENTREDTDTDTDEHSAYQVGNPIPEPHQQ